MRARSAWRSTTWGAASTRSGPSPDPRAQWTCASTSCRPDFTSPSPVSGERSRARASPSSAERRCAGSPGPMTVSPASLVWFFDIDGTLLLTKGAGRDALSLAFRDRFGIEDDLSWVPFGGRTDALILSDVLDRYGFELRDGDREQFWDSVSAHMRTLMDPPRGGLMPGIPALLDAIGAEPGHVRALLTGNVAGMARIKLESFGVLDRFEWGTFGDEAPDRNALARLAVQRAGERHGVPPERCVVVGDTEHDIACARAAGARSVAVATGGQTREALAAHAPDLLLDDLRDADRILGWIRRE